MVEGRLSQAYIKIKKKLSFESLTLRLVIHSVCSVLYLLSFFLVNSLVENACRSVKFMSSSISAIAAKII